MLTLMTERKLLGSWVLWQSCLLQKHVGVPSDSRNFANAIPIFVCQKMYVVLIIKTKGSYSIQNYKAISTAKMVFQYYVPSILTLSLVRIETSISKKLPKMRQNGPQIYI